MTCLGWNFPPEGHCISKSLPQWLGSCSKHLPDGLNTLQSWVSVWSLSFGIKLNIWKTGKGKMEKETNWLGSHQRTACWRCIAKPAPWLAFWPVLYFSAACGPNAVRNLSMVTAQHLFLFKERKRFGFSARIPTQVITLLPAEFPQSFNCSSCSSLPLLKSASTDLLQSFGNTAAAALPRQAKRPCHVLLLLDVPLVKLAASNRAAL